MWRRIGLFHLPLDFRARNLWPAARKGRWRRWHAGLGFWSDGNVSKIWWIYSDFYGAPSKTNWWIRDLHVRQRSRLGCQICVTENMEGMKVRVTLCNWKSRKISDDGKFVDMLEANQLCSCSCRWKFQTMDSDCFGLGWLSVSYAWKFEGRNN